MVQSGRDINCFLKKEGCCPIEERRLNQFMLRNSFEKANPAADKYLSFFREYAGKKWSLRGSKHADNLMWQIITKATLWLTGLSTFVGAASSRDKR
jgi:hypothetical protein